MTHNREFNAATVDEALEKASSSLGLSAKELSYEVLDEGSAGFLGIGARDARIVVELPEGNEQRGAEESRTEISQFEGGFLHCLVDRIGVKFDCVRHFFFFLRFLFATLAASLATSS